MSPDALSIAQQFAHALDYEDYETATMLISPECIYRIGEKTITGSEAIIASYRESGDWAKANLDRIEYESRVEIDDDGRAVISFVDHLQHEGESLTHTCRQILTVMPQKSPAEDPKNHLPCLITSIEHHDLPGEREAVRAFNDRHGIVR